MTIRGLRARAFPLVQAESITNNANGRTVADNGPRGPVGAGPETNPVRQKCRQRFTARARRSTARCSTMASFLGSRRRKPIACRRCSSPDRSSPCAVRDSIPRSAASSMFARSDTQPIGSVNRRMHRRPLLAEAHGPADRKPSPRRQLQALLPRRRHRHRAADVPTLSFPLHHR